MLSWLSREASRRRMRQKFQVSAGNGLTDVIEDPRFNNSMLLIQKRRFIINFPCNQRSRGLFYATKHPNPASGTQMPLLDPSVGKA
jgi:hypothetical protein